MQVIHVKPIHRLLMMSTPRDEQPNPVGQEFTLWTPTKANALIGAGRSIVSSAPTCPAVSLGCLGYTYTRLLIPIPFLTSRRWTGLTIAR